MKISGLKKRCLITTCILVYESIAGVIVSKLHAYALWEIFLIVNTIVPFLLACLGGVIALILVFTSWLIYGEVDMDLLFKRNSLTNSPE